MSIKNQTIFEKPIVPYVKLVSKIFGWYFLPIALFSYFTNKKIKVHAKGCDFYIKLDYWNLRLLDILEKKVNDDIYLFSSNKKKIYARIANVADLEGEYFSNKQSEFYKHDYKNKRVLDIGGYIGDSALLFLENGAKHITIYEPIQSNVELIKLNMQGNEKRYTIYPNFISDYDGEMEVTSLYEPGSMGFGIEGGENKYKKTCSDIRKVIDCKYDVIKMDCEGCEYSLLSVSDNLIRKIPYWIIEFHDINKRKEYKKLLKKFKDNKFKIIKKINLNEETNIIHFNYEV
ncbi:MAG: FkbM family methyltransferase [Candidatus Micrarchaeota archaeon]